jgi:uncharacterized membrane protein (UPF0127 family)
LLRHADSSAASRLFAGTPFGMTKLNYMTNKNITKVIIIFLVLVVLGILANYIFSEVISTQWNPIKHIYIQDVLVKAETVKSKEKIEKGLSGRSSIATGRGMLFQMPSDEIQHFWMKGMQFAIDIIWIENGRIISCEKNIQPSDPRIFASPGKAGYALEVPAGVCDENRVKINDQVRI